MDFNKKEMPIQGYTGMGGGAMSAAFRSAVGDYSVDFDGNDRLILASDAVLSPNDQDFTWEAWLYPDSWGSSYKSVYYNPPSI